MDSGDALVFVTPANLKGDTLPHDKVMRSYVDLRDACAETLSGTHSITGGPWSLVALHSAGFIFNAYKCAGTLLADSYYESAAPVIRQAWEACANLHFVSQDADSRARDFCAFTTMELRKAMTKATQMQKDPASAIASQEALRKFDSATIRQQRRFIGRNSKGQEKRADSWARLSIEDRAKTAGTPWDCEYLTLYSLLSMYAHAAPGAILHPSFLSMTGDRAARERDFASMLAVRSMAILVRMLKLLHASRFVGSVDRCTTAAGSWETSGAAPTNAN